MSPDTRFWLARSLWALPCTFAALVFSNLRIARFAPPTLEELAYLSMLAALFGAGAALFLSLLAVFDRTTIARKPVLAAVWVALASLPFTLSLGRYATLAEGLRAKGVPAALLFVAGMGSATLVVVVVWAQQRFARRPLWAVWTGLPLIVLFSALEGRMGFARRGSALLLMGAVVVIAAHTLATLLEPRVRLKYSAGQLGAMLVAGLALSSLFASDAVIKGRRRTLVRRSSLAQLDGAVGLFGERFAGYTFAEGPLGKCPRTRAQGPLPELTPEQRRNIIVVTIDTLRADFAEKKVNGKPLMPQLARFLRGSLRPPAAYTGYPATMMALGSAFTGLLPSRLTLTGRPTPSVFGTLKRHFDSVTAVIPGGNYFKRRHIETYMLQGAERLSARRKADQTQLALARLKTLRETHKRHLLWIHYFEPHDPYDKQKGFDFGSSPQERYMSELAGLDKKLGRLFKAFDKTGVYDDSLVLLFADHGESFGEHRHQHHHYHLYPWLVRVPFGMRVPGQEPRKLAGPVHLTDVAATILDFADVPYALPLDGMSLLRRDPKPDRVMLSEEFPMQSGVLERYESEPTLDAAALRARIDHIERGPGYPSKVAVFKGQNELVVHKAPNVSELFRLDQDPGVNHDLADGEAQLQAELRGELERYYARVAPVLGCTP
jgi:choline-sulfatase